MKRSIGVVFVAVIAAGGCDDGVDTFVPQFPVTPDVAEAREPAPQELAPIGRRARVMYDRLRAAGFVR